MHYTGQINGSLATYGRSSTIGCHHAHRDSLQPPWTSLHRWRILPWATDEDHHSHGAPFLMHDNCQEMLTNFNSCLLPKRPIYFGSFQLPALKPSPPGLTTLMVILA